MWRALSRCQPVRHLADKIAATKSNEPLWRGRLLASLAFLCHHEQPMRWIESPVDVETVRYLARELKVSPLVARLLALRGLAEPAAAQAFLHPSLGQLHPPELMAGMREAVTRLHALWTNTRKS